MVKFLKLKQSYLINKGVIICTGSDDNIENAFDVTYTIRNKMSRELINIVLPTYIFLKLDKDFVVTDFLFWDEQ